MIIVDEAKCLACGSCVEICHEHCMTLIDGTVSIDYGYCSTCTQCIAVCPEQALSWNHVPPVAYDETRLPSPEQLNELFKERRSIRFYEDRKIDRMLLEEIIGYGIYAPTQNFKLRAIVVDDEEIIQAFDRVVLKYVSRIYNVFCKPKIMSDLARMIGRSPDHLQAKPKLEAALERGYASHHPAAIVFIVGDRRKVLSEPSAQFVLYNMILYAQTKGIGSCLWANGPMFLDKNKAAKKHLSLHNHERIFGALLLGYPAVSFRNKVQGKRLSIQWNDGIAPDPSTITSGNPSST